MTDQVSASMKTTSVVDEAIQQHGVSRSELIPILKTIMMRLGFISPEVVLQLSQKLNLPSIEITSVATFYRMLSTAPRGKHVIQFCESAPCHVVGGNQVWQAITKTLNLQAGETSADHRWTLITTSCLGVCGIGPVMLVDTDLYGNLTPEEVPHILSRYD